MKYGPGDAEAGSIKFIKEVSQQTAGFLEDAQTRKFDFGDAYAVNRKCHKRIQKEIVGFWRGAEIKE